MRSVRPAAIHMAGDYTGRPLRGQAVFRAAPGLPGGFLVPPAPSAATGAGAGADRLGELIAWRDGKVAGGSAGPRARRVLNVGEAVPAPRDHHRLRRAPAAR